MKSIITVSLITLLKLSIMAKEIKTEVLIKAPAHKVWAILTQFETYPQWNPFIKSIEGKMEVGNTIKVTVQPYESKPSTFKPRVLIVDSNKELRWIGRFLFKGLFDGEHVFQIKDNGDGTCVFIQKEYFSGILVPLLKKMLNHNTKKGFEAMNQKLKELAES
jgi:hypothetical protein